MFPFETRINLKLHIDSELDDQPAAGKVTIGAQMVGVWLVSTKRPSSLYAPTR